MADVTKSGLDDKKTLGIESETHTKTLLMAKKLV